MLLVNTDPAIVGSIGDLLQDGVGAVTGLSLVVTHLPPVATAV